jgi:transposase
MNGYSEDLRRRIVFAVGHGMSKAQAASTFDVSLSSVKRYVNKAGRGESLVPKKSPGSAPKLDDNARKLLEDDLTERPYATLQQRRDYIETDHHGALGEPLYRVPRHRPENRLHEEKGGRVATERDEFLRAAWRVMVAAAVEPERLIFVDECGLHTSLSPIYGYAPMGERLHLPVPRNRGKNTTLLASMAIDGMGPSLAVEMLGSPAMAEFTSYRGKLFGNQMITDLNRRQSSLAEARFVLSGMSAMAVADMDTVRRNLLILCNRFRNPEFLEALRFNRPDLPAPGFSL